MSGEDVQRAGRGGLSTRSFLLIVILLALGFASSVVSDGLANAVAEAVSLLAAV